ncbi:MAG: helix-turn-helix transcriptional regulator [Clostridia bacterium]|nr:helix-turn-helix transcriptional regulator [Clostridia bacterium]
MTKNINFSPVSNKSSAQIVSVSEVEVTAPDGEVFSVMCRIGAFVDKETQKLELFWLESLFDKNFSENKEEMINKIWQDSRFLNSTIIGISSGSRYEDRLRIGTRIREIREERGIEARDLARLAKVDPANLSRIENGKYSVGLDILSKIAATLGKKVDFIDI